jgi:hypothetical protein
MLPASLDLYLTFKTSSRHYVIYFTHMVFKANHVVEGQSIVQGQARDQVQGNPHSPVIFLWRKHYGWPPFWNKPISFYLCRNHLCKDLQIYL